jgi:hypothetical protein
MRPIRQGNKARNSTAISGRGNRKTDANATLCRWPVKPRSLHSSASRIACGREKGSRSIFLLRTRAGYRGPADTGKHPRLGPPGASTFPRIWICSIDPCVKGVKRKTRHVVDFFAPCLFVVVVLHWQLFCFVSPATKSPRFFYFSTHSKNTGAFAKIRQLAEKKRGENCQERNSRGRPEVCRTPSLEDPARSKQPAVLRVSVAAHQTRRCRLYAFLKACATNRANKGRRH